MIKRIFEERREDPVKGILFLRAGAERRRWDFLD